MTHPAVMKTIATGYQREPTYLTGTITHRVEVRWMEGATLPDGLETALSRVFSGRWYEAEDAIYPVHVETVIEESDEATTREQAERVARDGLVAELGKLGLESSVVEIQAVCLREE